MSCIHGTFHPIHPDVFKNFVKSIGVLRHLANKGGVMLGKVHSALGS